MAVVPEISALSETPAVRSRVPLITALLIALLLAGGMAILTDTMFTGDTYYYVRDIRQIISNERPAASLFEFGHLLWRPAGYYLSTAVYKDLATQPPQTQRNRIIGVMKSVSVAATIVCVLFLWLLMTEAVGASPAAAALACAAFVSTNGIIQLSRAGASWVPGLAFVLCACWLSFRAAQQRRRWMLAAAALAYAFAVMLWVPYLLAVMMIAAAPLLVRDRRVSWKELAYNFGALIALAGILTFAAYSVAVMANGITSRAELISWVKAAAHGEGRDRQLLRMGFGLPRSFVLIGDHGVLWKQFLFRDPYAGVAKSEIIQSGAVIAAFYLIMAVLALFVWRSRSGRLLLWSATAVVPTLALALLFEAGSIERYLALYPAVFVCLAFLLTRDAAPRAIRALLACAAVVLILYNTTAAFRTRVNAEIQATASRVEGLRSDNALVAVLNVRDSLSTVFFGRNEHPAVALIPPVWTVIASVAAEVPEWKATMARAAFASWEKGGSFWVTKRFWAERPKRQWLWVEGDDGRVKWSAVRRNFTVLDVEAESGGPDGFNKIADNANNRRLLALPPAPQP